MPVCIMFIVTVHERARWKRRQIVLRHHPPRRGPANVIRRYATKRIAEIMMLSSFLMGLVGGQRAMTPLAMVSMAAARGELSTDNGAPKALGHPIVVAGTLLLAVGE